MHRVCVRDGQPEDAPASAMQRGGRMHACTRHGVSQSGAVASGWRRRDHGAVQAAVHDVRAPMKGAAQRLAAP